MANLRLVGAVDFRLRIVLATIAQRTIEITDIRQDASPPGLREYEVNFLRAVEAVSSGCKVKVNASGTKVSYAPGMLLGGKIEHRCANSRSIGYVLEYLLVLLPFSKHATRITLLGITNNSLDSSVDMILHSFFPVFKLFGVDEGLDLKIATRGLPPNGGGKVVVTVPAVPKLRSVCVLDEGLVKKIRGVALSVRGDPRVGMRMITSARKLLNNFIPDIRIATDHYKGQDAGKSPGHALLLYGRTTEGRVLSAEEMGDAGSSPEELGERVSKLLLTQIKNGGVVDSLAQTVAIILMALTPEDVSRMRFGRLSQASVSALRALDRFLGVRFRMDAKARTRTVVLTCVGCGYTNTARRVG